MLMLYEYCQPNLMDSLCVKSCPREGSSLGPTFAIHECIMYINIYDIKYIWKCLSEDNTLDVDCRSNVNMYVTSHAVYSSY